MDLQAQELTAGFYGSKDEGEKEVPDSEGQPKVSGKGCRQS